MKSRDDSPSPAATGDRAAAEAKEAAATPASRSVPAPIPEPGSGVFLSYRRDDAAGYAGRLFDRLAGRFGRQRVFMDVDAIGVGSDFVQDIEKAVGAAAVLLVLIGRSWLTASDREGRRRLDDEDDFVRLEVAFGLAQGRAVIPVLVDGAGMPGPDDLPAPLAALARRNAIELSNTRWDYDVGQLLDAIEAQGVKKAEGISRSRRFLVPGLAAAVLAVSIAGYLAWQPDRVPSGEETTATAAVEATAEKSVMARPSLAVVGLEPEEKTEETAWLATALAEMVATQLGAGGQLRTIGGDTVAENRLGLGLARGGLLPADDLGRLGAALGSDYLVDGHFGLLTGGELAMLRLELQLHRGGTAAVIAKGQASGTATEISELVHRASGPLRNEIGIEDLTPSQKLEVRASLPRAKDAARLYVEGVDALRRLDAPRARELFERAADAEPEHPMPHSGLATAWFRLGYRHKAEAEARRAVELSDGLSEPARLLLRGRHAEIAEDWPAAIRAYEELFGAYPDDLALGLRLADVLISAGRTERAQRVLEELGKLPTSSANDPGIDLATCRAAYRSGDYEKLKEHALAAKQKGRAGEDHLVEARADFWLGTAWYELGDRDAASAALEAARSVFEEYGHQLWLAKTLELLGIEAHRRGDLQTSGRLFTAANASYQEAGDRLGSSRILANQGKIEREMGHLSESERLFAEALSTAVDIGARYEAAQFLNEKAIIEHLGGDLSAAKEDYGRALVYYSEIGEKSGTAIVLTNLGEVSYLEGSIEDARRFHEEALATNREIGDRSGIGYDTFRLGLVALNRGGAWVARAGFEEAIALQQELEETLSVAETQIALARVAFQQETLTEAISLARQAEEFLGAEGVGDLQALGLAILGRSLIADRQLAEAQSVSARCAELAAGSEDLRVPYAVAILQADLAVASGAEEELAASRNRLRGLIAKAATAGHRLPELELRLALAEVEIALGEGRATAEQLAAEAEELGFDLIARQAAVLSAH